VCEIQLDTILIYIIYYIDIATKCVTIIKDMKYMFELIFICLIALIAVKIMEFATSIPEVKFSTENVEYSATGYPIITLGDVVEAKDSKGNPIPRSELPELLSSGRYDPVPVP
jgi:hypothetical protein